MGKLLLLTYSKVLFFSVFLVDLTWSPPRSPTFSSNLKELKLIGALFTCDAKDGNQISLGNLLYTLWIQVAARNALRAQFGG